MKGYKSKARLEKDICKEFYNQVRWRQLYKEYKNDFCLFHIANEQYNNAAYTRHLMAMGLLPGVFDYCVIIKGRVGFIEFKRDNKHKLSLKQQEFSQILDRLGVSYTVVYNSDDALEWLKEFVEG